MERILNTIRFDRKIIDATEYAKMSEKERSRFKSTRIIAPKLGSSDFGKIEAILKRPEYRIYGN